MIRYWHEDQIVAGTDEPVDVLFGCARFQIRDVLGDRRRGKEWAEREQRYEAAETVSDVMDPYTASTAISLDQAARMVADADGRRCLGQKSPTLRAREYRYPRCLGLSRSRQFASQATRARTNSSRD
jgi:hypothetical protein